MKTFRASVSALLAVAFLAQQALAYSGNCGIWAVRAGEFVAANYAGTQSGFNAALAYLAAGNGGVIGVNPGCTTTITYGTLPANVSVNRQEGGMDYKYGALTLGTLRSSPQWLARPLTISPAGGASEGLRITKTDTAYPDYSYPSDSSAGMFQIKEDITKSGSAFSNGTRAVDIQFTNRSVGNTWSYNQHLQSYFTAPTGATTSSSVLRGIQNEVNLDGANNKINNVEVYAATANVRNGNRAASMACYAGGVQASGSIGAAGKIDLATGFAILHQLADSASSVYGAQLGHLQTGGFCDVSAGIRFDPPAVSGGGAINDNRRIWILDQFTGTSGTSNNWGIINEGGYNFFADGLSAGNASGRSARYGFLKPLIDLEPNHIAQQLFGIKRYGAAQGSDIQILSTASDTLFNIGPGDSTTIAAHLRVAQPTTPTVTSLVNNGTTGTVGIVTGSTDMAGQVTVSPAGTGIAAGDVVKVTFRAPFHHAPKAVLISPANTGAAARLAYVDHTNVTRRFFYIYFDAVGTGGSTYKFDYWVVE